MCDKPYNIRGFIYMLAAILYFANPKVEITKYRKLTDSFKFSTPKLCKTSGYKLAIKMSTKAQCFRFQSWLNTNFIEGGNKNICDIYEYK